MISLARTRQLKQILEVALKDGCSAFAWIGCEIVGMHNGGWFTSSLWGRAFTIPSPDNSSLRTENHRMWQNIHGMQRQFC